jgi:peptidoglycan LD-endopeptidase LytH
MSALRIVDRLQTIAATATLTSAVWIVFGAVYLGADDGPERLSSPATATATSASALAPGAAEGPVGRLLIPVRGIAATALADTFDDDRGGRRHEAIDIMAPAGTPVIAAAPGTVEKLYRSEAGGNTIYVRSGDRRTIHYYAHLQDYTPGLGEGQAVQRGQPLGTVGSTGNADPAAPHLHFAILRTPPAADWWEAAVPVDPYPQLGGK